MNERASTTLRRMLEGPEIVVLPGAYDALSARLAERAGFNAMFTTGFGFSASVLGQPDFGLLTMSETMDRVRHVVATVSVPVVAVPTSTGYGAGFQGITALLAMLASCAAGITVVGIDNGFGAACAALGLCHVHDRARSTLT